MLKKGLLILSILLLARSEDTDDGVINFTDDNLEEIIANNSVVMVKFYAPWCGHCKSFAPEYAIAAKKAQSQGYVLGQLDATVHHKAAQKYGIQGFPTVKLFLNGEPINYEGERKADSILSWINKKKSQSLNILESEDSIEQLMKKDTPSIVLFAKPGDTDSVSFYEKASKKNDDFTFYVMKTEASKYTKELPKIVMFKNYDESILAYDGELEAGKVIDFFVKKAVPVLGKFNEKIADSIFREGNNAVFIFADQEHIAPIKEGLYNIAKLNKGTIIFSLSGVKSGMEERLANFIGVKQEDLPVVYIMSDTRGKPNKYKHKGTFTPEAIEDFVKQFNEKKLSPYFKSEPIPAINNENVVKVVADNFKDVVLDPNKEVLVKFYAPWCGHCKALAPIYEEFARKLKEAGNKNIVLADMDSTANEVDGIEIKSYPTLKFYGKKSKTNPIEYKEERTEAGLLKFMEENSAYHVTIEKKEATIEKPAAPVEEAKQKVEL